MLRTKDQNKRHCERSEAIFLSRRQSFGDCRVADVPLGPVGFAMTVFLILKRRIALLHSKRPGMGRGLPPVYRLASRPYAFDQ